MTQNLIFFWSKIVLQLKFDSSQNEKIRWFLKESADEIYWRQNGSYNGAIWGDSNDKLDNLHEAARPNKLDRPGQTVYAAVHTLVPADVRAKIA